MVNQSRLILESLVGVLFTGYKEQVFEDEEEEEKDRELSKDEALGERGLEREDMVIPHVEKVVGWSQGTKCLPLPACERAGRGRAGRRRNEPF